MKKLIVSLIIFLALTACESTQHGNFIKSDDGANEFIAIDSVEKITGLYLPAKTTLSLSQKIKSNDAFGTMFINGLRDRGFAVEEFRKDSKETLSGTSLRYTLDISDGIYRISIFVGNSVLSRAYQTDSGAIVASGYWSKKE